MRLWQSVPMDQVGIGNMKAGRTKALIAVGLLGIVAGGVAGVSSANVIDEAIGKAGARALEAQRPFAPAKLGGGSLADMVQAVGPAVVQIEATQARPRQLGYGGAFQDFFGGMPQGDMPRRAAQGSGFVIDPAGLVVTNNHVVADADYVTVKLSNGRKFKGRVLGSDPKTDLAVVKIEGGGRFKAIPWGDSDAVRVGDDVFAVGSPFGLGNSVTSGILSARGREIGAGPYDDFLQVDAPINSGNSGGPLFNAAGQVIGVNTAIFSPSGGSVGIGFAIPSRMAQSVVRQIVADGHVSRGRIGVVLQPLTPEIARSLDLASEQGALVAEVEPDGPAAAAGLRSGDVVTAFAGRPIRDSRELARAVAETKAGTNVAATVLRDGRSDTVRLRIGASQEG